MFSKQDLQRLRHGILSELVGFGIHLDNFLFAAEAFRETVERRLVKRGGIRSGKIIFLEHCGQRTEHHSIGAFEVAVFFRNIRAVERDGRTL